MPLPENLADVIEQLQAADPSQDRVWSRVGERHIDEQD